MKDYNLVAHVKVFKAAIKINGEIKNAKIINMFSFTIRDIVSDWCNNYLREFLKLKQ